MKNICKKLSLFSIVIMLFSATSYSQSSDETIDIIRLINSYQKALNSGNVKEMSALFNKDAALILQGSPTVTGVNSIEKFYAALKEKLEFELIFIIEETVIINTEWAFVRTSTIGDLTLRENNSIVKSSGHELFILNKSKESSWKILRYSGSSSN